MTKSSTKKMSWNLDLTKDPPMEDGGKVDDERHDARAGYRVVDAGGGPGVQDLLLTFQSFCSDQEVRENIINGQQNFQ